MDFKQLPEDLRERAKAAAEKAQEAFWEQIATAFSECKHGDFGPEETFAWDDAVERAITTWLFNNHAHPQFDE